MELSGAENLTDVRVYFRPDAEEKVAMQAGRCILMRSYHNDIPDQISSEPVNRVTLTSFIEGIEQKSASYVSRGWPITPGLARASFTRLINRVAIEAAEELENLA